MSKRKLLLADDSLTIQKVVNLTFADEGIEVFTVGDGDAAMRKFNEVMPDLVLADVNMPGPDGYQICEAIKQDELTKHIPVILLVGSFEPFDEEKARQVGADDFLTKPFQSIRQLVNRVSDLLEPKTSVDKFSATIENEAVSINSFVDTLEMPSDEAPETVAESTENLGDAGMDDEIIQTSQVGSVPIDEIHKFESAPVYQSFAEDIDQSSLKTPYGFENVSDYPPDENWAKTQPLSKADLEEFRKASGIDQNDSGEDLDELELLEFPQANPSGVSEASQIITTAELPGKEVIETETSVENRIISGESLEPEIETSGFENIKPVIIVNDRSDFAANKLEPQVLSDELIEAIASRVVEKLSGRVIKQIVREVMVQMERRK